MQFGGAILIGWLIYFLLTRGKRRKQASAFNSTLTKFTNGFFASGKVAGHKGPQARAFSGRAGRAEWFRIFVMNAYLASFVVRIAPPWGLLIALPFSVAIWAVSVRRLHDLGRSGWLVLVPFALATSLIVAGAVLAGSETTILSELSEAQQTLAHSIAMWLGWTFIIGLIGFYLWLGLARGKAGPNPYGEADPV